MEIRFCIQGMGFMVHDLFFKTEWNCSYIPRIGETINSNVFLDLIDSDKFRWSLNEEEQSGWDGLLKKKMKEGKHSESNVKKEFMGIWLDELTIKVKDVYWNHENGKYSLFMVLVPDK